MKQLSLCLCFFILIISCKQESSLDAYKYKLSSFEKKEILSTKIITIDSLFNPTRIRYLPEYNILIFADKNVPHLLKMFSVDSLRFIKSFGSQGIKTDEFLSIGIIDYKSTKGELHINDNQNGSIHIFNVDSILNSKTTSKPLKVITFNKSTGRSIVLPNNNIISARINTHADKIGVFNVYDSTGTYMNFVSSYPNIKRKYELLALTEVFRGRPALADTDDRIVFTYTTTDIIDLYDLKLNLLRRIFGPDQFEPDMKVENIAGGISVGINNNSRGAFRGTPRFTNSGIYTLYDGKELNRADDNSYQILHYSQNLEPMNMFELDKGIVDMDIDTINRIIYGIGGLENRKLIIYQY